MVVEKDNCFFLALINQGPIDRPMQVILWYLIASKMVRMFLEIGDLANPLIQVCFDSLLGLSIGEAWNRQGFGKNLFDALSISGFHFQTNPPLI
jgi:hypothetical protein